MAMQLNIAVLVLLCLFSKYGAQSSRRRYEQIDDIQKTVDEVYEILKQENRMRELRSIIQMEKMLDIIQGKVDNINMKLEGKTGTNANIHLLTNIEALNKKMETLESNLQVMKTEIEERIDGGTKKIREVYEIASKWEQTLDHKLKKMMNAITSVYEMNKDIKTNIDNGRAGGIVSRSASSSDRAGLEYVSEQIEDLQRTVKEEINVLSTHVRTNINSFGGMTRNVLNQWDSLTSEIQELKGQCRPGIDANTVPSGGSAVTEKSVKPTESDDDYEYDYSTYTATESRHTSTDRQRSLPKPVDRALRNLTKVQKQIQDDLNKGLKKMEEKISALSNVTETLKKCESLLFTKSNQQDERTFTFSPQGRESRPRAINDDNAKPQLAPIKCSTESSIENARSCAELRKGGVTCDGVYVIFPMYKVAARAFCDMTTDGGGWTVILRRGDFEEPRISFNRNWKHYKIGFGNPEKEYWIGNNIIHHLTMQETVTLRVNLESFDDDRVNITYSYFSIGDENDDYRISVGGLPEKALYPGSDLIGFNNRPFVTYDVPHQSPNCPQQMKGGWWFRRGHCHGPFLMGTYYKANEPRERWDGIQWPIWKGDNVLKAAEMKIRPQNF